MAAGSFYAVRLPLNRSLAPLELSPEAASAGLVSRTGNWPARPPAPARAGGNLHYLGGYERKLAAGSNSSDTVTKYYSASLGALSRPLAFRRGGTLHWVGADHLGGTIRVLDSSFTALDGMRYRPYGEARDTGSKVNTDRKFTGQTEDEAAGLYWYASRAYDPAIGRFVSPDAIVPAPGNPQSLNRYSYVYNNPPKCFSEEIAPASSIPSTTTLSVKIPQ